MHMKRKKLINLFKSEKKNINLNLLVDVSNISIMSSNDFENYVMKKIYIQ